jgi:glycosyltransferase involved in cell wall biosynthesis
MLAVLGTWKLAHASPGTQLVSVSRYTAVHLQALFNLESDAVVLNPIKTVFLEPPEKIGLPRNYLTFAGRLDPCKNLHRLLPAMRDLLDEIPHMRVCIIGEGEQKPALAEAVKDDSRFEFKGYVDDLDLRYWFRRTAVFVSGNETEGLGITYLEALSQGCAVVMPASGGGLEVALDQIGSAVHLLPLSFDRREVLSVLRRSVNSACVPIAINAFSPVEVAKEYLRVDSRFSVTGKLDRYQPGLVRDALR